MPTERDGMSDCTRCWALVGDAERAKVRGRECEGQGPRSRACFDVIPNPSWRHSGRVQLVCTSARVDGDQGGTCGHNKSFSSLRTEDTLLPDFLDADLPTL
jgi:hypothetical protein